MTQIQSFWQKFQHQNPEYKNHSLPIQYHFCDNEKDANECAELVIKGIKKATTASVWYFETREEKFPEVGDLAIVLDWDKNPVAITKVTKVEVVPFNQITEEYAKIEGEGDQSLKYWKKVHWAYYLREMKAYNQQPTEDMPLVCEYFNCIFIND